MTDSKTPPTSLSDDVLDDISGGPNRRNHDHIGNFNFKVEIEGVTQGVTVNSWDYVSKEKVEGKAK